MTLYFKGKNVKIIFRDKFYRLIDLPNPKELFFCFIDPKITNEAEKKIKFCDSEGNLFIAKSADK